MQRGGDDQPLTLQGPRRGAPRGVVMAPPRTTFSPRPTPPRRSTSCCASVTDDDDEFMLRDDRARLRARLRERLQTAFFTVSVGVRVQSRPTCRLRCFTSSCTTRNASRGPHRACEGCTTQHAEGRGDTRLRRPRPDSQLAKSACLVACVLGCPSLAIPWSSTSMWPLDELDGACVCISLAVNSRPGGPRPYWPLGAEP